jgi:hypothetical protein
LQLAATIVLDVQNGAEEEIGEVMNPPFIKGGTV